MSWVRLDDRFAEHPKVAGLNDLQFRAHVTALCYSARHLTDGVIPTSARLSLNIDPRSIRKLVESGLWETHELGWKIHDYSEYNPTRESVATERAKTRDRVAAWRSRNAVTAPVTNTVTEDARNGVSNRTPSPTRPQEQQQQPKDLDNQERPELDALIATCQLSGNTELDTIAAHRAAPLGTIRLLEQIAARSLAGEVRSPAAVVRSSIDRDEHLDLERQIRSGAATLVAGSEHAAEQAEDRRRKRILQAQRLYDAARADGDTHQAALGGLEGIFRSEPEILDTAGVRRDPDEGTPRPGGVRAEAPGDAHGHAGNGAATDDDGDVAI